MLRGWRTYSPVYSSWSIGIFAEWQRADYNGWNQDDEGIDAARREIETVKMEAEKGGKGNEGSNESGGRRVGGIK